MKLENAKSLESLSLFCHLSGLFTVFIGIVMIFMNALNGEWRLAQVGLYIFATGYALTKISSKVSQVVVDETQNTV